MYVVSFTSNEKENGWSWGESFMSLNDALNCIKKQLNTDLEAGVLGLYRYRITWEDSARMEENLSR